MTELEREGKRLELERVRLARKELQYQILLKRADIERMEKNIEIQVFKEKELEQLIQSQ